MSALACTAQVVQRRVDLLAAEGITFKTNVHVGSAGHLSGAEIKGANDAVVLAVGSTRPRDLDTVPGREVRLAPRTPTDPYGP